MKSIKQKKNKNSLSLFSFFFFFISNAQTVSTFVGSGVAGGVDGNGVTATFKKPVGIAIDGMGNIFISDYQNNRIRKITADGTVTTFAGSSQGYLDGTGASAQFYNPFGIAIDATNNIYVGDYNNFCVRKITPSGVVTTLAGSGIPGYVDGAGTAAQFNKVAGLAVDTTGNVFVADQWGNRIRKITSDGIVTTFAGSGVAGKSDGTGTAAEFNNPVGLLINGAGMLFVSDYYNHRIRKITPNGVVTTVAGTTLGYEDGPIATAQFTYPSGLATDAIGNLYISDESQRIRKISTDGVVTTFAGNIGMGGFVDGPVATSKFNFPKQLAIDADGSMLVADSSNNCIRKITGLLTTDQYQLVNEMSLYPNPTSSIIYLNLEETTAVEILLFDINGRKLKCENFVHNQTTIDLSHFVNGMYIIQITTNKGTVSKKIMKQ